MGSLITFERPGESYLLSISEIAGFCVRLPTGDDVVYTLLRIVGEAFLVGDREGETVGDRVGENVGVLEGRDEGLAVVGSKEGVNELGAIVG